MTERITTPLIMRDVILALLPGLAVFAVLFGSRVLLHMGLACLAAITTEVICLRLRGSTWRDAAQTVRDGSAVVTALLIVAAVPPAASPGISMLAAVLAIGLAKQAFGGLGRNLFNPAMTGYALVLVSFPAAFSLWPANADGLTGATMLDVLKHDTGHTLSEFADHPAFGDFGAAGFELTNLAWFAGGLYLLWRGLIAWRIPAGLLLTVAVITVLLYDGGGSGSLGTPLRQWFAGGLMLAALFIATDPVTHPRSTRAQWCFGLIIGIVVMMVRASGSFPDGIAFGVLLANACTPWLDRRFP
jgi:electron transport complex protein RnfD